MSKRKPAWRDPRGPHVRLYEDIFDSAAWLTLSPRTRLLYIEMRTQLNGLNNGDVSCTLAFASKRNVTTSDTTLSEALFQLEALGFIRCMRRGLVRAGAPLPSLFRFTDEPFVQFTKVAGAGATGDGTIVYGPGAATFDYRKFKTRDDAEAQLAAAIADRFKKRADRVERGTAPGFRPLQKLERATPKNGSEVTRSTPKNGQEVAYPTPKTGDLMQLGVGVAARRKAGTGRKRALEVTVAGTTYKRLLCAADCCDHPECLAARNEPHARGCDREVCPVCRQEQWVSCKCTGKLQVGWLSRQPRRRKEVAAEGSHVGRPVLQPC